LAVLFDFLDGADSFPLDVGIAAGWDRAARTAFPKARAAIRRS